MHGLQVSLWMWRRAASLPLGWIWMLASLAGLPLLLRLAPAGVLAHSAAASPMPAQVAFLASMGGAMLAVSTLARADWMLELAGPYRRLGTQSVGVLALTGLGAALVLGTTRLLPGPTLDAPALAATVLGVLHLAGLGILLLQVPSPPAALALGLPLLGWLIPSVLPSDAGGWIRALLQAHHEPLPPGDWTAPAVLGSLGPIFTCAALALLLVLGRSSPPRLAPR